MNSRQPEAQAVAIRGDCIVDVGLEADVSNGIGPQTEVIDAAGGRLMPGFNDAHVHFLAGGLALLGIDLRGAKNEQEFAAIIMDQVASLPSGQWVIGWNWDHEAWPSRRHPTRGLIDPFTPDNPVLTRRLDGHIAMANSLALRLAGITRETPDPAGGQIGRDARTGEPTGILIDNAQLLVTRVIPEPTLQEKLHATLAAMRHAASLGVTSVQTMGPLSDLAIYQHLRDAGELITRIYAVSDAPDSQAIAHIAARPGVADPMLRTGAVKLYASGSLGAGSALLFEPYDDQPQSAGLAIYPEEELYQLVAQADAAGLQVALHAIGDKANHWALNAFERAIQANGPREARHRIEHAQVLRPSDAKRLAPLGVIASIQPSHCIDDMRWVEKRLGERAQWAYPFNSLLAAGARVALGTDWTVEPLDPMLGLYAAVTREFPGGGPSGGWYPAEKTTLERALRAYTLGSAYAEFREREKGSIAPGKLADMVLLSQDIIERPAGDLLTTQVDLTCVGGRIVYRRR